MGFPVKDMNATALADKDQTPIALLIYFHGMIAIVERVIGRPCFFTVPLPTMRGPLSALAISPHSFPSERKSRWQQSQSRSGV